MKDSTAVVRVLAAAVLLALGACSSEHVPEHGDSRATGDGAPPTSVPAALPAPKLAIEQTDFDFGKMETNGTGRHEFVIANRGGGALVLRRGKNSCGCCTCVCDALLSERGEVAPGGSARVTLQWKIKRYTGNFRQSETLATNDPERPEVTLAVTGRITPTVRVVPAQLVFTRVPAGEPATGEVRLYAYREQPLEYVVLACASGWCGAVRNPA